MLYSNLTPSFVNKTVQNILRNFGLRSVISSLERPQLIKFKYVRKAWAHYLADQVSIPLMKVMHFENLQITNISALNQSALTGRARIKSRVKVKKGMGEDLIDFRDL